MSPRMFDIAQQLFDWLEKREVLIRDFANAISDGDEDEVVKWMNGKKVDGDTVREISQYFKVSPKEFYGRKINLYDFKPCGVEKVLIMLNQSGKDYMADNDDYQQNQHVALGYAKKKGWHTQAITDEPNYEIPRKQDNEHS